MHVPIQRNYTNKQKIIWKTIKFIEEYLYRVKVFSGLVPRTSKKAVEYKGFYDTWEEALKDSTGYNSQVIFHNVKEAAIQVKQGKALFERDSILFYEPEYNWPLLALLFRIALDNDGKINLVDFGGSLGSIYYQNRNFLSPIKEIRWNIIEQEQFVNFGNKNFKNAELFFYKDLEECFKYSRPKILLASALIE